MNRFRMSLTAILSCVCLAVYAGDTLSTFPILAIPRTAGESALLKYELTPEERKLFKELDAQTAELPRNASTEAYRSVAANVGRRHGLSPEESYAFFMRTTFSAFEP